MFTSFINKLLFKGMAKSLAVLKLSQRGAPKSDLKTIVEPAIKRFLSREDQTVRLKFSFNHGALADQIQFSVEFKQNPGRQA
jgi:hypothetical protein